jgi:NADPH:quinone reductase-like Zn-dependent oxidoreductase
MKAIRIHEPAGISGLVYEEAPDAKPMACDVLVKVAACGITHTELDWPIWTCRAGHQRTSVIPGHEVSGVVAARGCGTAGIAVGDEVFGLTDQWRDGAGRWPRSWAPTASSRWTPTASRTRPARPTWYSTRSAARCSPVLLRPGGTLVSVATQPPPSRDDIREVVFIHFIQEPSRA